MFLSFRPGFSIGLSGSLLALGNSPIVLDPIFHCSANPFALGPRVGLDTERHDFALGIPISQTQHDPLSIQCDPLSTKCDPLSTQRDPLSTQRDPLSTQREPQREPVEYGSRWVCKGLHWACTFHVVCVNFIHAGYPTRTWFLVEYGL